MKTLQTILGSLALAGAVTVPASGQISKSDSLDSLMSNNVNTPRVELMQAKEKTDAEKIFDFYKEKMYRLEVTASFPDGTSKGYGKIVLEFGKTFSDGVKSYTRGEGLNENGRTRFNFDKESESKLVFYSGQSFKMENNMHALVCIGLDKEKNIPFLDPVVSALTDKKEMKTIENASLMFEEFSKEEYAEINKIRKGIIGKYKAESIYSIKDDKKVFYKLDENDFSLVTEHELSLKRYDPKTDKSTFRKVLIDYKDHNPLEIELTDSGRLIYNPSKYKVPHSTIYDLNISDNIICYHSNMEVLKVVPEDSAAEVKEFYQLLPTYRKIVPIFEPDGTFSLELHTANLLNGANQKETDYVYVLKRAK